MAAPRALALALVVVAATATGSVPTCGVEGGGCETRDDPALLQVNDFQTHRNRKAGAKSGGVYTMSDHAYSVETTESGEIFKLQISLPAHGVNTQWPAPVFLWVPSVSGLPAPAGYIEANAIERVSSTHEGIELPGFLVTYTDGARCMAQDITAYTNALCQDWFLIAPAPTVKPIVPTPSPSTPTPPAPTTPAPTTSARCCFHMSLCPSDLTVDNEVAGCVPVDNFCSASAERCLSPQTQTDGCDGTNTGTANVWCPVG